MAPRLATDDKIPFLPPTGPGIACNNPEEAAGTAKGLGEIIQPARPWTYNVDSVHGIPKMEQSQPAKRGQKIGNAQHVPKGANANLSREQRPVRWLLRSSW
jgi:hypothetical protein